MIDTFKTLIVRQYEAALSMLRACIERCPDAVWNSRGANYKFCQLAFHTLIFTDLYLGHDDEESFRRQSFHLHNQEFFGDYEEFEDHLPVRLYNIRHIQHHTGQLSLRLRVDAREDIVWVGSGWREVAYNVPRSG